MRHPLNFSRLSRRFTLAACASAALALAPAAFSQQKLQIAGNFAAEHPSSVAIDQVFKKEVARLTNNQLQVDVFPAMQLVLPKRSEQPLPFVSHGEAWISHTHGQGGFSWIRGRAHRSGHGSWLQAASGSKSVR